ncbi:MAG: hypothetical protein JW751_05060 [Polyangiaceae bacterium]|nr:hypothetical protein [Polyangiaceae bacterium]
MPRCVHRGWSALLLVFAVAGLLFPSAARASVPICSEQATTDFAPAPMVAVKTAEMRAHRVCEIRFRPSVDVADPVHDPSPPPPTHPLERGCAESVHWPTRPGALCAMPPAEREAPAEAEDQGIYRPPRGDLR